MVSLRIHPVGAGQPGVRLPRPRELAMAKFVVFACWGWSVSFCWVLSESVGRSCRACGPYAGSCRDLTQRCGAASVRAAGCSATPRSFRRVCGCGGGEMKKPFVISGTFPSEEINFFLQVESSERGWAGKCCSLASSRTLQVLGTPGCWGQREEELEGGHWY